MNLPEIFRTYLTQKKGLSRVSAKNYVADFNKFLRWFEANFSKPFTPELLTSDVITLFKQTRGGLITGAEVVSQESAARSFERYMSSLRRFANFLTEEKYLASNPFDSLKTTQVTPQKTDTWDIKGFKDYLYVNGASKATTKNYVVDILAFTGWIEATLAGKIESANFFDFIDSEAIDEYKLRLTNTLSLSPTSVNRKLSSIRKFVEFAASTGHMNSAASVAENIQPAKEQSTQGLRLSDFHAEHIEEPNEAKKYSPFPPLRLAQKLFAPYVALEGMIADRIAAKIKKGRLAAKALSKPKPASKIRGLAPDHKNILIKNYPKEMFAPHKISLVGLPLHRKIIHHARHTRPNWYKQYHNYPIVHYFHFAVLVIYASVLGFIMYSNLFAESDSALAAPTAPPRILNFQGRLTDITDTPITTATDIRFSIYDDTTASGAGNLLWQEVIEVEPDQDGIFSELLGNGSACAGQPLTVQQSRCQFPDDLFTDNATLYLGITIENTAELAPRQRLAAVAYAANSEALQGMYPITDADVTDNVNTILALDASGNLTMGGTTGPTFQATGAQFTLSGQTLLLTTEASTDGDVILLPDGLGKIDLEKPLVNNTNNGNIAIGGVEVNDRFGVLATESAVAAFIVNNDTTGGDIFTASSSATTRFRIANDGDIFLAAGAAVDTLATGTLSIGGATATTLSLGRTGQGITLPAFTGQNGVLFGTFGSGALAQATTTITGQCLVSGASNPTWDDCPGSGSSSGVWNLNSGDGTLYPINATLDLLIGGTSTASADFAVLNVAGNGPATATISGNLIVMPKNGAGGNVGIGTISPTSSLHVFGTNANLVTIERNDSNNAPIQFKNSVASVYIGLSDLENFTVGTGPALNATAQLTVERTSGDVGIGTTSPDRKLEVVDGSGPQLRLTQTDGSVYADFQVDSNGDLIAGVDGTTNQLVLDNSGSVGIGTATPQSIFNIGQYSDTVTTLTLGDDASAANYGLSAFNNHLKLIAPTGFRWLTGSATGTEAMTLTGGNLGINSTSPLATFDARGTSGTTPVASVSGNTATPALLVDNAVGAGAQIVASKSGQPVFVVDNDGNVIVGPDGGGKITAAIIDPYLIQNQYTSGNTQLTFQTMAAAGGDFIFQNQSTELATLFQAGLLHLAINGSSGGLQIGDDTQLFRGSQDRLDLASGDSLNIVLGDLAMGGVTVIDSSRNGFFEDITVTGSCSGCTPTTEDVSKWEIIDGALSPRIKSLDLLLGSSATQSAKFGFINVLSGTPTATISANSGNGATYLTGAGNLGTVNKQTLSLGGSSTGLIQVLNSSGSPFATFNTANSRLGIGTTTPGEALHVSGGNIGIDAEQSIVSKGDISSFLRLEDDSVSLNGTANNTILGAEALYLITDMNDNGSGDFYIGTGDADPGGSGWETNFFIDSSSSFVGIGTADPDRKLDILSAAGPQLRLTNTNASIFADFQVDSNGDLIIGVDNTTNQLVLDNGGNIGIGTAAPGSLLDVRGSAVFNEDGIDADFRIESDSDANLFFADGGTNRIGIGTNNPTSKLDVRSSSTIVGRFTNTGASGPSGGSGMVGYHDDGAALSSGDRLGFFLLGGAVDGSSTLSNSAGISSFATANWSGTSSPSNLVFETTPVGSLTRLERLRIDSSGNVGINTTTPTALLDVAGNASTSGTLTFRGTTDPKINILNGENFGILVSPGGDAGLAERFTILNNGNVGIFNTAPDSRLAIGADPGVLTNGTVGTFFSGDDTTVQIASNANNNGAGPRLRLFESNPNMYGTELFYDTGLNDFSIVTYSNNSEIGRIHMDGANVGINNSTPDEALDVVGQIKSRAANHQFMLYDTDSSALEWSLTTVSNTGLGIYEDATTPRLIIAAGGNTGVGGDTTPDSLFSVGSTSQFQVNSSGAIAAATGITSSGNITFSTFSTNGGLLYTNGSGLLTQLTSQGASGDCLVSGGAGAAPSFTACGTAAGDDWTVANGTIYPNLASTLDLLLGSTATASAEFAITGINGGTPTASISATTNGLGLSLNASSGTFQSLRKGTLTLGGDTTGDILFAPGNSSRSLLLASNGNVGLGSGSSFYNRTVGENYGFRIDEDTRNHVNNPSAEVNTTGWTTNGSSTAVRDTTTAKFGDASIKLTATATAANSRVIASTSGLNLTAGATYTLSAWIYAEGDMVGKSSQLLLWEVGGSQASQTMALVNGSYGITLKEGWNRYTVTGSLNQNDRTSVQIYFGGIAGYNWQTGEHIYIDGVQLEEKAYATSYADGSLGTGYSWTGTAHNSNSVRETGSFIADGTITAVNGINVASSSASFFGGQINLKGNLSFTTTGNINLAGGTISDSADGVDIADDLDITGSLLVTSTSNFQGAISNSAGLLQINDNVDITGTVINSSGNFIIDDEVDLGSASTGINILTTGEISDINGNLILDDTVDIGGANGVRIDTAGTVLDINGNLVLNDTTDIGHATDGLRIDTSGNISDIDDNVVINDVVDLGSATTGINILTSGQISDIDGDVFINDGVNISGTGAGVTFSATGNHDISASSGTLRIGGFTLLGDVVGNSSSITGLDDLSAAGTITFSGFSGANDGGVIFANSSGVLSQTAAGTSAQCLLGGTTPSWGSCATGINEGKWTLNSTDGTLYPINTTLDVLVGGTATDSAKFAVLNIAGGTPTASISANSSYNALYLRGDGNIGTTNRQTLKLGGTDSGELELYSLGEIVFRTPLSNVFIGENVASTGFVDGNFNVIIGEEAGRDLTEGGGNVLVGYGAGLNLEDGNQNVFVGQLAGDVNTDGSHNTFIGDGAGTSNTSGSFNTFVGFNVGNGITDGQANTFIGYNVSATSGSIDESIALGNNVSVTGSNQLVIGGGNTEINDAYIGSGVTDATPSDTIINATGGSGTNIGGADITLAGGKGTGNAAGGSIILSTSVAGSSGTTLQTLAERVRITASGTIDIGGVTNSSTDTIRIATNNTAADAITIGNNNSSTTLSLTGGDDWSISSTGVITLFDVSLQRSGTNTLQFSSGDTFDMNTGLLVNIGNAGTDFTSGGGLNLQGTLQLNTLTNNGGILFTNGTGQVSQTLVGSTNQCLLSAGGGSPTWGNCALGVNYWTQTDGMLHPINSTLDLAIGGTSTSSAKFTFTNVTDGDPTFTVYGPTGAESLALSHDGTDANIISSTGTIKLGSGGGNLYLTNMLNRTTTNDGALKISDKLKVENSEAAGNVLAMFNNTGAGDILTASSSGTTRFTINTNGAIGLTGGFGSATQCITSNGAGSAATWGTCGGGGGVFQELAGAIVPNNSTTDFLIGGQATSSALFKVTGVASGNPRVGIGTGSPSELLTLAGNFLQTATSDPTIEGSVTDSLLDLAHSVYVSGKYAYVTGRGANSLAVIDISSPSSPTIVGSVTGSQLSGGRSVYVSGKYAYVATDGDRLTLVDISNPKSPSIVSSLNDSSLLDFAMSVYVSGKYAYVAAGNTDRLTIVDISNPSSPTIVGSVTDSTKLNWASSVYVSGRYAYVTTLLSQNLTVIDISNPNSPIIVGTVSDSDLSGGTSVYVSGRYAYAVTESSDRLTVVDISNPYLPSVVDSVQDNTQLDGAQSVYVSGKYAYVAATTDDYLTVIDVSDPSSPTIVGSITDTQLDGAQSVYVSGKYAYVTASGADRLNVIDITGIDAPSATIGNIAAGTINIWDDLTVGNNAYIQNGLNIGSGGLMSNGSFTFNSASSSGNLIQGAPIGNALLTLNQLSTQDILTASSSGTTRFRLTNGGNLYTAGSIFPGGGSIQTTRSISDNGTFIVASNLQLSGTLNMNAQLIQNVGQVNVSNNAGGLQIGNTSGNDKFKFATDGFGRLWIGGPNADGNAMANLHVVGGGAGGNNAAVIIDHQGGGDILAASASGTTVFTIANDGALFVGSSGTAKITAGTFDPLYTIDGHRYSTYAPSMIGVKEEITGKVSTNYDSSAGAYIYELDFNNFNKDTSTDFWVFSRAIDPDIEKISVLLTPNSQARAWYRKDPVTRKITLYSDRPTEISYRLTAPRFDHEDWATISDEDRVSGLIAPPAPPPVGNGTPDGQDSFFANLNISLHNGTYQLIDSFGNAVYRVEAFSNLMAANLAAGLINAQKITTNALTVTADNVKIDGQDLRNYIVSTINNAINNGQINIEGGNDGEIVSPIAKIDEVETDIISPLTDDVVEIAGDIEVDGDVNTEALNAERASISGELAADNITSNNASISGTLYADNIKANSIDGLEDKIASFTAQFATNHNASPSANYDIAALIDEYIDQEYINLTNISSDFATFREGLIALGPTTVTQMTATDSISVGTNMIIGETSINTLSGTLAIQPHKQGAISFMAGAITIETDGTLNVNGNANFAGNVKVDGKLSAGIIAPLSERDLSISLAGEPSASGSALRITDASGADVLAFNNEGNIVASGSATFGKLNLAFAEQAYATSDTQAIATGSAGLATLKRYRTELTISNPNVTEDSLIYITPVGDTNNQILSLRRQVPASSTQNGSFTVGVSAPAVGDIKFNWIIVN